MFPLSKFEFCFQMPIGPPPHFSPICQVVVGGASVGKSALVVRLVQDHFFEEYDPTVADTYRKSIEVDGETTMLDILDTAGREENNISLPDSVSPHLVYPRFSSDSHPDFHDTIPDSFPLQWIRDRDGFILVFSITRKSSFEEIKKFRNLILLVKNTERVPMVIVETKLDLEYQRQIDHSVAKRYCDSVNELLVEASSKDGVGVEVVFQQLVRMIRRGVGVGEDNDTIERKEKKRRSLLEAVRTLGNK